MNDLKQRLDKLTPAARRLLARRLASANGVAGLPQSSGDLTEPRRSTPATDLPLRPHPDSRVEGVRQRYPLSSTQKRVWFLEQLEPGGATYHNHHTWRLRGALDTNALAAALNQVVRRHEALRTSIAMDDGVPVQVVSSAVEVRLRQHDLGEFGEDQSGELARRLCHEQQQPFDLSTPPLLRASVYRLAPEEHVLALTLHHLITDGWSDGLINREISHYYACETGHALAALPEPSAHFGDYVLWQEQSLSGHHLASELAWWQANLRGSTPLDFPTDRPRPPAQTGKGSSVRHMIPVQLSRELKVFCQRRGATLFMSLLAAFNALIYRYSGQQDFVIGTPIAGRKRLSDESAVGFFANTVVLRNRLSGESSFVDLVDAARDTVLGVFEHQELPFDKLVEALAPERDLSRNPLFQFTFALQGARVNPLKLAGIETETLPVASEVTKFDLAFAIADQPDGLDCNFTYSTDLFDSATIERMAVHFNRLLESLVAEPDRPIHSLEMLGDDELQTLLVDWNATELSYDRDVCIHALIERQATLTPERVAVVSGGEQLSYAALDAKANQLAHFLRAQGVVPEQLIGLCVSPSLEMLVGIVGVLKAGGAYVPMDPGYPEERLAFMVEDSGVPIILSNVELPFSGAASAPRTVRLDRDWEQIAQFPTSNPEVAVSGSNIAYMIYTSGSTGTPKGVLIEHRSVRNLAEGLRVRLSCDAAERPLRNCLSASISFDASVDNWVMLAFGDELHVISRELRTDSTALLHYLRERQIDVFDCVPSQLTLMLEEGLLSGSWTPGIITVGGEAVDQQTWSRLAAAPGTAAYNLYGPTECTVEVMVADIVASSPVPVIGRPLANSRIYLLDAWGSPVPLGAVGEIHVGGDALARGYHRRPELTAAKFRIHALPGQAPQRLYRTGDFGRYLPDGTLSFLGRRDGMVKLRGHTIELGEIEAVIARLPRVLGAVALVREDDPQRPLLTAYVRCDRTGGVLADDVRTFVASKLPAYMVPSAFVIVEQFPLTPSGKIDRKALPQPDTDSLVMRSSYAPAVTVLQNKLAGIWRQFIAVERIGIDDDFFELGGHSLLATRVINRINRDCGVNLALRVLFEQPTIRRLSAAIEQLALSGHTTTTRPAPPIAPQPRVARKRPKPEE